MRPTIALSGKFPVETGTQTKADKLRNGTTVFGIKHPVIDCSAKSFSWLVPIIMRMDTEHKVHVSSSIEFNRLNAIAYKSQCIQ